MLNYRLQDDVAVAQLDDGKANAVGFAFIEAVNIALDNAVKEAKAIAFFGRPGRFCAGFDLSVVRQPGPEAARLSQLGGAMMKRIYTHPQPVVIGCTGHALAAGALFLLAGDTRVGATGNFKIGLNETAIGLGLPAWALALVDDRISKRHHTAAVIQSEIYDPMGAVDAGYLDTVVEPDDIMDETIRHAQHLTELPTEQYGRTKNDLRVSFASRM